GLTVAAATLFSLFISFTLTPMLASRWLKAHEDGHQGRRGLWERFTDAWEGGFDRLASLYGRVLRIALHARPVVVLIGAIGLAVALAFIPLRLVGTEYAPSEDDGQFRVNVQTPPGTNLETTNRAMKQIEAAIQAQPEVESVFTSVGVAGFGAGSNQGSITVSL